MCSGSGVDHAVYTFNRTFEAENGEMFLLASGRRGAAARVEPQTNRFVSTGKHFQVKLERISSDSTRRS